VAACGLIFSSRPLHSVGPLPSLLLVCSEGFVGDGGPNEPSFLRSHKLGEKKDKIRRERALGLEAQGSSAALFCLNFI
jgi:hypothetical protein